MSVQAHLYHVHLRKRAYRLQNVIYYQQLQKVTLSISQGVNHLIVCLSVSSEWYIKRNELNPRITLCFFSYWHCNDSYFLTVPSNFRPDVFPIEDNLLAHREDLCSGLDKKYHIFQHVPITFKYRSHLFPKIDSLIVFFQDYRVDIRFEELVQIFSRFPRGLRKHWLVRNDTTWQASQFFSHPT